VSAAAVLERVSCKPLAEAAQRCDLSYSEIGARMGWPRRRSAAEATRALGMKPYRNGSGEWRRRESMPYEQAVRFCEAMDVDPVEVGL
jgi:hypothetical protein